MKSMSHKCKKLGILVSISVPPTTVFEDMMDRAYPPLALGYLVAAARRRNLLQNVDIEIWDEKVSSVLGDESLARAICKRMPLFVGFSCYCWSIARILNISRQIKKLCPDITIIVGGPEVSLDNKWLIKERFIDFLVFGEGEKVFCDLLEYLLGMTSKIGNIAGIAYRKGNKLIKTSPAELIQDLDSIGSGYIDGQLKIPGLRSFPIETMRGCLFQCTYCHYGMTHLRYRSTESIIREFKLAKKHDIPEVYILAPSFNLAKNFREVCLELAKLNRDRKQRVFVELRADYLKEEDVELLKACNVVEAGIGLQTISRRVFNYIKRRCDLESFRRGLRLLSDANIRILTDIIVGLPGETLESVKTTAEFLRDSQVKMKILCYWLCVLPDTALRRDAEKLSINYMEEPPYYVKSTRWMSNKDMVEATMFVQRMFYPFMDSSVDIHLPLLYEERSQRRAPGISLNRLIIDLDQWRMNRYRTDDTLIPASVISDLGIHNLIWFIASDLTQYKNIIQKSARRLIKSCPNAIWDLVFNCDGEITPSWLSDVAGAFRSPLHYLNHPLLGPGFAKHRYGAPGRCYVIAKWHRYASTQWKLSALRKQAFFLWNISLCSGRFPFEVMKCVLEDDSDGVFIDGNLVDYTGDSLSQIIEFIGNLNRTAKAVRFSNISFQKAWYDSYGRFSGCKPSGDYDCSLYLPF